MAKKKEPSKAPKAGRKPCRAGIPKKAASPSGRGRKSSQAAYALAVNPQKDVKERQAAFASDPTALGGNSKPFAGTLKVMTDPGEPLEVRLSAFDALGAARFSAPDFESGRSEYIAALRKVAGDDDPELRQRALGTLAREKDGFAQKKLIAGLEKPDKALVPPEKALQLLSYDPHADAYAIAREIVDKPPNSLAKDEALRLLGSDPGSAPLLEKVLRDKGEPVEARQISAAALHVIDPAKYQEQARALLLDEEENPDIQSMSLTALTYFGDEKVAEDRELSVRVEELNRESSGAVQAIAKKFIAKFK